MTDNPPRPALFSPALFRQDAIAEDTAKLNDALVGLMTGLPEWWNVGAETTREARRQGRGPFPAPVKSPRARTIAIPGRDGNEIPLRIIAPDQPRGVYLHIHGGGWVLGSAPTCRIRCWNRSPTTLGWPWSAWNTGWRRRIPIRPDPMTANSPPPGWWRMRRRNSAPMS